VIPSCVHVDKYLTVEEQSDVELLKGFFLERIRNLWPASLWAFVWSFYRGLYYVSLNLALVPSTLNSKACILFPKL